MTPVQEKPCHRALDARCFEAHPEWAKQALAYKLLHFFVPPWLSRNLPLFLRNPLIGPGVIVPPGYYFPPGTIIPPGTEFPDGWTAADPLPDGVVVPPGAVFPPGWTTQDPLPDAVVITPDAVFPDDWTPGDPLPDGVIVDPAATFPDDWTPDDPLPDGVTIDPEDVFPDDWTPDDPLPDGVEVITLPDPQVPIGGPLPPIYTDPFEPGPLIPPGESSPVAAGPLYYGSESDGYINCWKDTWPNVHAGAFWRARSDWASNHPSSVDVYYWFPDARIERSFLYFDLSEKPDGKEALVVHLRITGFSNASARVCVQQGTQWDPFTNQDWSSYTGEHFGFIDWIIGLNTLTFNEAGLEYINSIGTGVALLCLREYDHDYLNVSPVHQERFRSGMYYQDHSIEAERPHLQIIWG